MNSYSKKLLTITVSITGTFALIGVPVMTQAYEAGTAVPKIHNDHRINKGYDVGKDNPTQIPVGRSK